MKRQRHQKGSLIPKRRADGVVEWILRYRITAPSGKRVQTHAVIGTLSQYPTKSAAQRAADAVRLEINKPNFGTAAQLTVQQLIAHYVRLELADDDTDERKSWSTKDSYRSYLRNWIQPRWGQLRISEIRTIEVEDWLRAIPAVQLLNGSKAKVRSIMSAIFNHAIRYDWLPMGKNPIRLVRQSAKRNAVPFILIPEQINRTWRALDLRERAMVSIEYSKGLRISEGIALKWSDCDFTNLTVSIQRGFVKGHLGRVKTEASQKLMPLDPYVAEDLLEWRKASPYPEADDFIFASSVKKGKQPVWPQNVMVRYIRPAAARAGVREKIGWHTFRRTYATLLKANGEDVKTVQELMRHASSRTALDVYAQAIPEHMRMAQSKVVEMIRSAAQDDQEEVSVPYCAREKTPDFR